MKFGRTKLFVALQLELVLVSMNDNQIFWQMEYLLSVSKLSEVLTNLYYLPLLKCFLFYAKRLILCNNCELCLNYHKQ